MSSYTDFLVLSDEQYLELTKQYENVDDKGKIIKEIKVKLSSILSSINLVETPKFMLRFKRDFEEIFASFSILYPVKISESSLTTNVFSIILNSMDIFEEMNKLATLENKTFNLKLIKKLRAELFYLIKEIVENLSLKYINIFDHM